MERFTSALDDGQFQHATKIERDTRWVLIRARTAPTEPAINMEFYRRMLNLSKEVHQFCTSSGHIRFDPDSAIVSGVMEQSATAIDAIDIASIELLWRLRMYLQTEALKLREPEAQQLYGVWFDSNYELAFLYFGIDYFLLHRLFANGEVG